MKIMDIKYINFCSKHESCLFRKMFLAGCRAHSIFLVAIFTYFIAGVAVVKFTLREILINLILVSVTATIMLLFSVALMRMAIVFYTQRPERPILAISRDLRDLLTDRRRLACGLPMFLTFVPMFVIFAKFKSAIPLFSGGFQWDLQFADWDRWLHFGYQPWEWLQPVLGYPIVTFLINVQYNFWFFVMWMYWCAWAFATAPSIERTRFLLAFIALWIVAGNIIATALSSAGPAFFNRLGHTPDPYAPLMTYLHRANEVLPIWAVEVQDILWQGFDGTSTLGGISAMPSLHNAVAFLLFLSARPFGKLAVRLLGAHVVIIYLGSIHLAWHYAIDAYLGWACAIVVWLAAKPVAHWWHATGMIGDLKQNVTGRHPESASAAT